MSDDDLYKNIDKIKSQWRFMPEGKRRDNARILAEAIKKNGVATGSHRGMRQIHFNKAYDDAVEKLFKLANSAPDKFFQKLYKLVIVFSELLYDEREMLQNSFIDSKRYREITKGNFLSKIKIDEFSNALYCGCKTAMMYEIKQIKQMHPLFKGRTSINFLRIVATSKELGLTPQQARGYLRVVIPIEYNGRRIRKLYEKLT